MRRLILTNRTLLICLLLACVTGCVYLRVARADFILFDDDAYVTQNRYVQSAPALEAVRWAFTSTDAANWHPVTWLSHMVDWRLYGMNAGGHHLTSLAIHTANVVLLFLLLQAMTGAAWRSAFVAALFGLHPLHVESVAWVAERKDVLSAFFFLLTVWAYFAYTRKGRARDYTLSLGLFALGLMSKPMLVTLPLILLLLDVWPLKRPESRGRLLMEKLPFFALSAASCVVTFLAQQGGGAVSPLGRLPLSVRLDNAVVSYIAYLLKTVWPAKLALLYPHPARTLPQWEVWASLAALAGITALAVRARGRHPYLLVGWLWYLVTLLPVIGIVQVGSQAMADRYTYIPLIGIFIAAAWGLPNALSARWRRLLPAAGVLALAALSVLTYVQLGYWRGSLPLFGRTLEITGENPMMQLNMAAYKAASNRVPEAVRDYRAILEKNPGFAQVHNNLGILLAGTGRLGEAAGHLREAARLEPKNPTVHNNLGNALVQQNRLEEAVLHYRRAIELKPSYGNAHANLAVALFLRGDYAGAWEEVHRGRRYHEEPPPDFLRALSDRMPEPYE